MATNVALLGAGGKMGCRITDNLRPKPAYSMFYVEIGQQGLASLAERSLSPTAEESAVRQADIVILALPDRHIGSVSRRIVPQLKAGALVVGLDPAAAFAGALQVRQDVGYFITHPCHPPLFGEEASPEAQRDYFGGTAIQDIVCALHSGSEDHYVRGETIARDIYHPVRDAYRITVEQMAILEPALVETTALTCLLAIREALDTAVEMGVPREAAHAFLMGHLRVLSAVVFGYAGFPVSDGAKRAAEEANPMLFQLGWKEKIMNLDSIRASVLSITDSSRA